MMVSRLAGRLQPQRSCDGVHKPVNRLCFLHNKGIYQAVCQREPCIRSLKICGSLGLCLGHRHKGAQLEVQKLEGHQNGLHAVP